MADDIKDIKDAQEQEAKAQAAVPAPQASAETAAPAAGTAEAAPTEPAADAKAGAEAEAEAQPAQEAPAKPARTRAARTARTSRRTVKAAKPAEAPESKAEAAAPAEEAAQPAAEAEAEAAEKPAKAPRKAAKAAKAPKASKAAKTSKAKAAKAAKAPKSTKAAGGDDLPPPLPPVEPDAPLSDSRLYINRELNWIEFDRKVLDEACNNSLPLLEQLKFLSIFYNNLDEFFMVRVANVFKQFNAGAASTSADGLTPAKQLTEIRRRVLAMLGRAQSHWKNELQPALDEKGVHILRWRDLNEKQRTFLEGYFDNEIYPILTPQAIDAGHPFPMISNTTLSFLIELESIETGDARYARLKCPNNMPRFIFVPRGKESGYAELGISQGGRDTDIILLEDLIRENLAKLFPGHRVLQSALFRITRNTDIEIEEDEADDLLSAVKDFVDQRRFGDVIRLEIEQSADGPLLAFLTDKLSLLPFQVYRIKGPLAMSEFMPLAFLDRPHLKDPSYKGMDPAWIAAGNVFEVIKAHDVLLYHPYESFNGVLEFIRRASLDPQVVAIKQTLYRCGNNSPIVAALIDARKRGKQVTAVVELKARFDEERNINWAEEMEKQGVNIVYGFAGLKIHAKVCLVVRREPEGMVRYVHISTGNYNPSTAKIYTDFALFTANPKICADASDLFNVMTGYSTRTAYRELVVSPHSTRSTIIDRIEREIANKEAGLPAGIQFKCNQLVDRKIIEALYRASRAGVKVQLLVRGICCLRPGLSGISENIRVTSIVGTFLEHARAYWFMNAGDPYLLIGSADLMPRNLDGRIEVLVPVLDKSIRDRIKATLDLQFADNCQCWEMQSDGRYARLRAPARGKRINSQMILAKNYGYAPASKLEKIEKAEKIGAEAEAQ